MTYSPRWIEDDGKMKPLISYLHVLPIENRDLPHCAQVCCWCSPRPDEEDPALIVHNALTTAENGWILVGEMTMPIEEDVTETNRAADPLGRLSPPQSAAEPNLSDPRATIDGVTLTIGERILLKDVFPTTPQVIPPLQPPPPEQGQAFKDADTGVIYVRDGDRWLSTQPAPQPISVGERLPGPGDCDAEGRCWFGAPDRPGAVACWDLEREPATDDTHWLPAHALPVPADD